MPVWAKGPSLTAISYRFANRTKPLQPLDQALFWRAVSCQELHKQCVEYAFNSSSQRSHRLRVRLLILWLAGFSKNSAAHHSESLQHRPRRASLSGCILITWPAHVYLYFKCVSTHIRAPACFARAPGELHVQVSSQSKAFARFDEQPW